MSFRGGYSETPLIDLQCLTHVYVCCICIQNLHMPGQLKSAAAYVQKGGVGKTTSTAHIGVAAAVEHDMDVLLIDLAGTQNDLATHFGLGDEIKDIDAPISAIFGENWGLIQSSIDDVFDRMVFDTGEGPDLIPSDPGLSGADNNLANVSREDRYGLLEAFIADEVAPRYDFVLLDLPGKEDNIALNGLYAVEDVITPLKPGAFERNQLANLDSDLAELAVEYPVEPHLALVLPTMIDRRANLSEEFVAEIEAEYPGLVGPMVVQSQNIGNLQAEGMTLFGVDADELYGTGQEAREAYREATMTLLEDL